MTTTAARAATDRPDGRPQTYDSIPVVDLGPYMAGEPGALEAIADEVRHIMQTIGFLVYVNHGLPWHRLEAAYEQIRRFCALPEADKLALRINHLSLGYVPPKSTIYVSSPVNKNTKKDLNETLILALDRPDDHPWVAAGTRFIGPNQWPPLPGFREVMVAYQQEIKALALKLLPIYAVGLGKPADFFDGLFTDPIMWSRNAHYPAVEAEDNQFGIAPHYDHSFMTLLPVAEVPGLQVLTPDGDWLEATYVEEGIIVNIGEFLNRWCNGHFMATPHRVVPPARDRYSIATFFNPNPDTLADPRDFCAPGETPQSEPVTMMDYVCWYIDTNYKRDAGGAQT